MQVSIAWRYSLNRDSLNGVDTNMAKSTKRKEVIPDWLDAELKALPDLDEGLDLDLPGLDIDFSELDDALGLGGDLPGLDFGLDLRSFDDGVLRSHKSARARDMGYTRATKQRCGAKTRTGKPCKAPGNGRGGRCKMHGGASTGPRTAEGKARSLAALRGNRTNRNI